MKLERLRDLLEANDPAVLDQHGQWSTDLPTFGGDEPENTDGVWSWDETRLIVGTCSDDVEIVSR